MDEDFYKYKVEHLVKKHRTKLMILATVGKTFTVLL